MQNCFFSKKKNVWQRISIFILWPTLWKGEFTDSFPTSLQLCNIFNVIPWKANQRKHIVFVYVFSWSLQSLWNSYIIMFAWGSHESMIKGLGNKSSADISYSCSTCALSSYKCSVKKNCSLLNFTMLLPVCFSNLSRSFWRAALPRLSTVFTSCGIIYEISESRLHLCH